MGDFDEPSFPTPVGSHGDGKNVSSTALPAKVKTPGVGKNEEELDPKSGVGFPGSLDEVAPQEQTNARQLGSTPGVGKNEEELDPKSEVGFPGSLDKVAPQIPGVGNGEDWDKAQSGVGTYPFSWEVQQTQGDEATPARDIVAVQDGETEIAIGFGNDGDGDRAISQDLAAAQRRPPEPHALQLRSERSLVVNPQVPLSEPEANTDKQGLLVFEPTTQSSELALKPPARSSELVGFSADAYYSLMQFSNSRPLLGALHHQNRKMDVMTENMGVMTENMGVMAKTMDVMAENMGKLLTKQADDDDDKIGLRAKVEQLSKRLVSAENYLRRLEQTVKAKVCNIEELEAQVIQLSNSLKDIQEDERQKQETLADKSAREEELHEQVRQLEKEVRQLEKKLEVAKQYVPANPENKYPLDPFTGYAIMVYVAEFTDPKQKEPELENTRELGKALFDYGFAVKPMRNPTEQEFREELEKCDEQHEKHNLVFIYIAAHGNSTGFCLADSIWENLPSRKEVAAKFGNRTMYGRPTVLCVTSCRHHVNDVEACRVDILPDQQRDIFLVDACRLGCICPVSYNDVFIKGMMNIFQRKKERRFLIEIKDLQHKYEPLDFDCRLRKSLMLPACPKENPWTSAEQKEACQQLENAFKYPDPASEHRNSSPAIGTRRVT